MLGRIFRRRGGPRQTIEPPNEAELAWVRDGLRDAVHITTRYGQASAAELPRAPVLDEAFATWFGEWLLRPPAEREDPNPVVNALGLAFGQELIDDLGLEWAVVTDEHGVEIAVHGQPGDLLVFPTNLVAKRLERGETRFFVPLRAEIEEHVRTLRAR